MNFNKETLVLVKHCTMLDVVITTSAKFCIALVGAEVICILYNRGCDTHFTPSRSKKDLVARTRFALMYNYLFFTLLSQSHYGFGKPRKCQVTSYSIWKYYV